MPTRRQPVPRANRKPPASKSSPLRLWILVGILIIAVAFFVATQSCSAQPDQPALEEEILEQAEPEADPIDEQALLNILGSELTSKLMAEAADDEQATWIAAHPEAYAGDGARVQYKLLRLAAIEPRALSFVRNFPDQYPQEQASEDTAGEDVGRAAPQLFQWDERWGYTVYSSTTFGLTGCCPTSMAMVYQGLTGKTDKGPFQMGQLAQENGYMDQYNGTDQTFLINIAPSLGLSCRTVDISSASLRAALAQGEVVICNVTAGDFTDGMHYLVITGMDDEGKLLINDPFSAERSDQAWDVDQVIRQTRLLLAYHA